MSKIRISSVALLLLAVTAITLTGCGGRRTIVKVNGEKVKRNEFYARLEKVPVQTPQGSQAAGRYVMQQIISEKLVQQLAKEQGVEPTEAQINKKIDFAKKQSGNLSKALAAQGMTLDDMKKQIAIQQSAVNVITKGITISDDRVKQAYDQTLKAKNSPFIRPEQVMVSAIVTKDKATIDKAYKQLNAGQEFGTVAMALCDPSVFMKQTQGKVGWTSKTGTVELPNGRSATLGLDFAKRVYAIEVGKYTQPFVSDKQWVILRSDQKRPKKITTYEEVKDMIKEQMAIREGTKKDTFRLAMQKFAKNSNITINSPGYKDIAETIKKEAAKNVPNPANTAANPTAPK